LPSPRPIGCPSSSSPIPTLSSHLTRLASKIKFKETVSGSVP
jgi:hypothetical protein